jgi:hypothetical protein
MTWQPKIGDLVIVTDIAQVHQYTDERWERDATLHNWARRGQVVKIEHIVNSTIGVLTDSTDRLVWYPIHGHGYHSFKPANKKTIAVFKLLES